MKKTLLSTFLCILLFCLTAYGQEEYYWYNGKQISIELDKKNVNIQVDESFNLNEIAQLGTIVSSMKDHLSKQTSQKWVKLELQSEPSEVAYRKTIEALKNKPGVGNVAHYFKASEKKSIGTSNLFYVKLKQAQDVEILQKLALENGLVIVKQNEFMPLWYTLSIDNKDKSSVAWTNYFYETGYFEAVDPAFMFDFSPNCSNDPQFNQLWGLQNNTSPGIDIDVCNAWDMTEGNGVQVAVVDQGIDNNHNDLSGNISGNGYDAVNGSAPSVLRGSHGTHVAGTIGAIKDNNLQVVGVAPQSDLLSVSHSLSIGSNTSQELADGINWAWQNGAEVISNSWGDQGGEYYNNLHSSILENSIVNAINQGRNGKGCIVVFAAGNFSPAIDYPASFHPNILCVGAIQANGNRAAFSGFGPELDVVAPGVNILSTVPDNATDANSGTSMAAPHVSGIAALVLSMNPDLTGQEVRDVIENSSNKVGSYNYTTTSGRPNGTWNNQMGYGLVNAETALLNAIPIDGPDNFCDVANFSLGESPSGVNVSWQAAPSYLFTTTSGTGSNVSLQTQTGASGEAQITFTLNGAFGQTTVSKSFYVGTPYVHLNSFGCFDPYSTTCFLSGIQNSFYSGETVALGPMRGIGGISGGVGSSNWEWERVDGDFKFVSSSSDGVIGYPQNNGEKSIGTVAVFQMNGSNSYTQFRARARNSCGWGNWKYFIWDVQVNGAFSYYPNPASNEIIIENYNTSNAQGNITLYDHTGNPLRTLNYNPNKRVFRFNVSDLPSGRYLMNVQYDQMDETHHILIQH